MTEHARTLLLLGVIALGVAQIRAQRRLLRAVGARPRLRLVTDMRPYVTAMESADH